jgi:hypothetical protein
VRVRAHPVGERVMIAEEGGIVAALAQPGRLGFPADVEEADRDPVEPDR